MTGTTRVKVKGKAADATKVATQVCALLNAAQVEGIVLETALYGALYAIGAALKQRGIVLRPTDTLEDRLTPLVAGYNDSPMLMPEGHA